MKRLLKYNLLIIGLLVGFVALGQEQEATEFAEQVEDFYDNQPSLVKQFFRRMRSRTVNTVRRNTIGSNNTAKLYRARRIYRQFAMAYGVETGGEVINDVEYHTNSVLREDVEVFGWHPYFMGNAYENYSFNLLSTIAYFSYDIDPNTGDYRYEEPIKDWKTTGLIDSAHQAGCKVLLTISNLGSENNRLFFANQLAQQNLIDSLINLLGERNADGINIDFENIPKSNRNDFTNFVKSLSVILKQINPNYKITMALPAVDHNKAFDIEQLKPVVDYFIIMGYDYHYRNSNPGSIAPLPNLNLAKSGFNLRKTVIDYVSAGLPKSRMIMALPYYGTIWESNTSNFNNSSFRQYVTYRAIKTTYEPFYDAQFDTTTNSYYFNSFDTATQQYIKCWYENEHSLAIKYDWINDEELRGVGVWALGYDNGYVDMWQLLDEKFTTVPSEKSSWRIVKFLVANSRYFMVGITYLMSFIFIGVVIALLKKEVSHFLFTNFWFRSIYLFTFIAFIALWLYLLGYFNTKLWWFILGLYLGYLLINYYSLLRFKRKSRLP